MAMFTSALRTGRALAAVLALSFLPANAASWQLDILDQSGQALTQIELPDDGAWCMIWNHSVAGFPVEDCYKVRNGQLLLDSSHQPDFAAGLGHIPGRGVQQSDGEGGYLISDMNEPVINNRYLLRVGALRVNHRIQVEDRLISLSQLAAGERVEIRLTGHQDHGK